MGLVRFSMMNFQSWSEIVFEFRPTPEIMVRALAAALVGSALAIQNAIGFFITTVGIGVATGEMIAGYTGTQSRATCGSHEGRCPLPGVCWRR